MHIMGLQINNIGDISFPNMYIYIYIYIYIIIMCLSTFYNVKIGLQEQCLFSYFMYFNNYETSIIREHKNKNLYSNIIIVQLVN